MLKRLLRYLKDRKGAELRNSLLESYMRGVNLNMPKNSKGGKKDELFLPRRPRW